MAGPQPTLVNAFTHHFLTGGGFATINAARNHAADILAKKVSPGTALAKQVDEAIEASLVRAARNLVQASLTTHEAYDRLVNLHDRQPALNVRSSTSVLQQAYSTPVPIAYLASTLAGITLETTVYEPTAGHGALLLATDPARATVNELNPERAEDLRSQGYQVTQHNAVVYQPDQLHDMVIANPPFGVVRDAQGQRQRFALPGNRRGTTQIDHAIAFQALSAMKADGKAVLILAGKLGTDEALRSERYNTLESRGFFYALYQQYTVTQHITIWGELYRKQGAGFPIDLIVISGRGASERLLPAATVPPIYKSFTQLKELIPHERLHHSTTDLLGIRDLLPGLETQGNGRSGHVSGAGTSGPAGDDRRDLSTADTATGSVDDLSLDDRNQRASGNNGPSISPGPEQTVFPANSASPSHSRDWRTQPHRPMGRGMERNSGASQRDADHQVRTPKQLGLPDVRAAPQRSSNSKGLAERTRRRDHPGDLAELPDCRDELRLLPMVTPEISLEQEQPIDAQAHNVAYVPRSQGTSPGTLIPANMAAAAQTALDNVEQHRGNIDEFVCQRLGYDSTEAMWRVLYAEQIDSLALAFEQRDQGKIFLNGDQTGNGKGRFGAANIIDAQRQGLIPIFVTRQPDLYNAMINDLADIGKPGFTPFLTNNSLTLELDDGRRLRTASSGEQEAEMLRLVQQGNLGKDYGAVFTTYSQLQTIKNKEPFRRQFFRALAPSAVFIFDESHEAGGSTGQSQSWRTQWPTQSG
ncbi:strawberry notch family protein [Leptothoe sp. EHU-05/26/07-4]